MKKFCLLLFSIGILGISLYGLLNNSFYVQILMNLNMLFIYARIALVAVLLLYDFVPSLRLYTTRALLSASGILMLLLGVVSVGSPNLLGHTTTYMLLGDSLMLIEAGILAIVLSAELSARKTEFMARSLKYIRSHSVTRPSERTYSPPLQPAKIT